MATHSSVLAWRIPGTGEPGGLPSMGSHRVGHDWSDLAAAAAAVLKISRIFWIFYVEYLVICKQWLFYLFFSNFNSFISFPSSLLWLLLLFSRSIVSDSLQAHGLQHARLPCLSPTPGACSNSCPSSWWCHPTIASSVIPFSSHLQSFPASGSFLMSQFFTSGGQNIEVSASASALPTNIQNWFPLGWTDWISLQSKGLLRVFSNTTVQKHQFFST